MQPSGAVSTIGLVMGRMDLDHRYWLAIRMWSTGSLSVLGLGQSHTMLEPWYHPAARLSCAHK